MLFNSFEFIFVFLPITLAGYYLASRASSGPGARIAWLAFASLCFYGYWQPRFLIVIAVSIVVNYFAARLIGAPGANDSSRKLWLVVAVALNLGAIGFYKYTNFAIDVINTWRCSPAAHLSGARDLPLGISFFTFTQIAYLVDVFFGHPHERNAGKYLLFVTYFPHLIAGPILHHKEMMPQFSDPAAARITARGFAMGVTIFAIGLFKKAVVADGFSLIANPVFKAAAEGAIRTLDGWSGALAYSVQIYYDFSGYSDMAIGLSLLFGIVLPFNFDSPYKSRSIIEFWRRWHITLSRFLRDYLYFPLGGNRHGPWRRARNLALTMILGGLWHGAGWTYLAWGALHGAYLLVNHRWREFCGRSAPLGRLAATTSYALAALALTQGCVIVAWVFFRADSMATAGRVIQAMVGRGGALPDAPFLATRSEFLLVGVAFAACLVLPNVNGLFARFKVGLATYPDARCWSLPAMQWTSSRRWAAWTAILLVSALLAILIAGDGTQFLYFQF
jgi:alginate O-acetyltransferase complex protein AlgI